MGGGQTAMRLFITKHDKFAQILKQFVSFAEQEILSQFYKTYLWIVHNTK